MNKFNYFTKNTKEFFSEILLIIFSLVFSFWLMFHTFSYKDGSMLIATKAWSDFASHIPLIRSFSLGDNFPPQYPLFPGEPIRYHFLFYALAGFLEKIGFRIDYALNIPSAISFAFLIIIIYFLAKILFNSKTIALLSIVFFLFNGSFAFLEFFKIHPLSLHTINDVALNSAFPAFGPYDGKIISAFWNLNIYTNQRHLALPLALLLTVITTIVFYEKRHKKIPWKLIIPFGIIIGILPFSHSSVFIMSVVSLSILFLLLPNQRLSLFSMLLLGAAISLPRIFFLSETALFKPGLNFNYLITPNVSVKNFLIYWISNLGLFFFMIPLGFFLSGELAKKILVAISVVFIIGHSVQFSPEIAGNHKFFNLFLIVGNMFAAYATLRIWGFHLMSKILIPFLIFFMVLSGIIDFFPIKNDTYTTLPDYPKNPDIKWIIENTPKDSVFLNSSYLYHPASLAGRRLFLGWPYFAWSQGYDTNTRDALRKSLLSSTSKEEFCIGIQGHTISYVVIENIDDKDFSINKTFFNNKFPKIYENPTSKFTIYATKPSC